jgi:hypothetical protein
VKDEEAIACGSCIMVMIAMRLEKLRQVDLNLLITFAAIAEEKSITAAASRLLLSQPAVSRALQRARHPLNRRVLKGKNTLGSKVYSLPIHGKQIPTG